MKRGKKANQRFSCFSYGVRKKGQFFIIAAVILSVVVISLVATRNSVLVTKQPERFYDLSYEINYEASKVVDYGVYNDENVNEIMKNFTEKIAGNIRDQDPDVEFVFIYGNKTELVIENYGRNKSIFEVGNETGIVSGAETPTESKIHINFGNASFITEVQGRLGDYRESWRAQIPQISSVGNSDIRIEINKNDYTFNIGRDEKFFMIVKKVSGSEEYVSFE